MSNKYFVLKNSEDGLNIELVTEGELLSRLTLEDGRNYYGTSGFFSALPDDSPPYWDEKKLLIIRGDIITPKPVQQVTKWDIE